MMKFYLTIITLWVLSIGGYATTVPEENPEAVRRAPLVVSDTNPLQIFCMWDRIQNEDPIPSVSICSTLLAREEWLRIGACLFSANLENLSLSNNGFDESHLPLLTTALRNSPNLTHLDLSRNPIGNHVFSEFAPILSSLNNLQSLNVRDIGLNADSLKLLANHLPPSLRELSATLYPTDQEVEGIIENLVTTLSQRCPHFENLKLMVWVNADEKQRLENKYGCLVIINP